MGRREPSRESREGCGVNGDRRGATGIRACWPCEESPIASEELGKVTDVFVRLGVRVEWRVRDYGGLLEYLNFYGTGEE